MAEKHPKLLDVLEIENAILREGHLDQLEMLTQIKQEALENERFSTEELTEISSISTQNSKLIQAAMSGVSNARARVLGHAIDGAPLETYTADGQQRRVRTARPNFEIRR